MKCETLEVAKNQSRVIIVVPKNFNFPWADIVSCQIDRRIYRGWKWREKHNKLRKRNSLFPESLSYQNHVRVTNPGIKFAELRLKVLLDCWSKLARAARDLTTNFHPEHASTRHLTLSPIYWQRSNIVWKGHVLIKSDAAISLTWFIRQLIYFVTPRPITFSGVSLHLYRIILEDRKTREKEIMDVWSNGHVPQ